MDNAQVRGWFDPRDLPPIDWQGGPESSTGDDYVEVGPLMDGTGRVAMRHSTRREEKVVVYTAEEWAAFVGGVKDGEFDFGD